MKKFISIALLLAVLLSCCACGSKNEATEPSGVPTLEELLAQQAAEEETAKGDPSALYGSIDQTVPVNGVYKIWNAEGVQLMAEHPDADFEFLCSIDMEGATLKPIGTKDKPFTGVIDGVNTILSNFTVEATDDGYLGFLGYSEGTIRDLKIENVTYVAKENTKYMGGIAGYSTKDIRGCTAIGTMAVTAAAEEAVVGGMVGQTTGRIVNSVADVDITYTAAGSATIGGLAGICENSEAEFSETYGILDVTGTNKKVGLIFGDAKMVTLQTISFLGEKNTLDGKLVTNYFGSDESVTYETILVRDNSAKPLTEGQEKLRNRVVEEMYKMGTVEWHTTQNLYHDCTCLLTVCHGNYVPGRLHVGLPYNHKGGSLSRHMYLMDENGAIKDFAYSLGAFDGFDAYTGNDCSTSVAHAWWTVSNSVDFVRCKFQHPNVGQQGYGCIAVGDWSWEEGIDEKGAVYTSYYTEPYVRASGEETVYESYAQMRKGDAYFNVVEAGGHTRMAAADPVVVRDENGKIDPKQSYVLSHEQGAPAIYEPYFTTWRLNYKYSFQELYQSFYLPITCEELLTGEMEPVECKLEGDLPGKLGLTSGTVKANYFLDRVTLEITDSEGNVVMNHIYWTTVDHNKDAFSNDNGIRNYNDEFNMANFSAPLQNVQLEIGETYTYTVTANLSTGDSFVLKTDSFTNGQA